MRGKERSPRPQAEGRQGHAFILRGEAARGPPAVPGLGAFFRGALRLGIHTLPSSQLAAGA